MELKKFLQALSLTNILFLFSFVSGNDENCLNLGKEKNQWNHYPYAHPNRIVNTCESEDSCDSSPKYTDDVQLIKQMGMDFYRFSISWSRILQTGYSNDVSKDGVAYYHRLLDELERYNITPIVTMYHWDHPQLFQYMGGWTNDIIIDLFADYARVVFREFGHRVKMFATINEPDAVCRHSHVHGEHSSGLNIGNHASYLCAQHVLKAHARAYHIYDKEFRSKQNGKVGIVLELRNYWSKNKEDVMSEDIGFQFQFGIYAHPIFSKEGDWPAVVKQRVNDNSKFEGLLQSRLPVFTKYWINYIKGTSDYMVLNHYSTELVEPAAKSPNTIYPNDDGLLYSCDPKWPTTTYSWLKLIPKGFLTSLLKVKKEYNDPLVYVIESGVADDGNVEDNLHLKYFYSYIKNKLSAINRHKCNVRSYTVSSLIDLFEWSEGYHQKYSLFHIDFNIPNRTRTPNKSTHSN